MSTKEFDGDTRALTRGIGDSDGLGGDLNRGAAAVQRDRAAVDRDVEANVRDRLASDADSDEGSSSRHSSARWESRSAGDRQSAASDRVEAALDREQAAADRRSASEALAHEGLDDLTGALDRGFGLAVLQREIDRSERTGESLVVAFIDSVGGDSTVRDHGPAGADRGLQDVAECLAEDLRDYDLVTRVGGSEFVCAQAGQSVPRANVRYSQVALRVAQRQSGARMTFGLAERRAGDSLEGLVKRADQATTGKRGGAVP